MALSGVPGAFLPQRHQVLRTLPGEALGAPDSRCCGASGDWPGAAHPRSGAARRRAWGHRSGLRGWGGPGRCGPLWPRPACRPTCRPALTRPVSPQELLLFLQNLPTAHWGDGDVSLLLAEAYRLKFAFADAPSHYKK